MKPFISLIAMALGAALVTFIVMLHDDPLVFTTLDGRASIATAMQHVPPIAVLARTAAPSTSAVITIEEVLVEGRLSPTAQFTPREAVATPTIVPAPCQDGEYRLLEPTRGVRTVCPGSAALQLSPSPR